MSDHGLTHDKEDPLKSQTAYVPVKHFVPGPRLFGFGTGYFIYFALATVAMAMASVLLHRHGNAVINYPGAEVKHLIGLALFCGIWSMIVALGSYALPLYFLAFVTFASSVIWAVLGGLFYHTTPFHGSSCPSTLSATWAPYTSDCKEYLTLHAISWTLWIVSLILAIAVLVVQLQASKRGHALRALYGH